MSADLQVGYWVYRSEKRVAPRAGTVRGVHYNGAVSNGSLLSAGNGFLIGDTAGSFDELNISAGVTTMLAQNCTLAVGAAAPLRTGNNRTFDFQVGCASTGTSGTPPARSPPRPRWARSGRDLPDHPEREAASDPLWAACGFSLGVARPINRASAQSTKVVRFQAIRPWKSAFRLVMWITDPENRYCKGFVEPGA